MKSSITTLASIKCIAVAAALLLPLTNVQAQESKVGFVNSERILRETTLARQATSKIEQEFSRRKKELQDLATRLKSLSDKLDKEGTLLSEADRVRRQRELTDLDKEFQRKDREFREDLSQRKNEELSIIIDRVNQVIRQIAEAEKYDIVFQEAVYFSPRTDMTDKVLKALNK